MVRYNGELTIREAETRDWTLRLSATWESGLDGEFVFVVWSRQEIEGEPAYAEELARVRATTDGKYLVARAGGEFTNMGAAETAFMWVDAVWQSHVDRMRDRETAGYDFYELLKKINRNMSEIVPPITVDNWDKILARIVENGQDAHVDDADAVERPAADARTERRWRYLGARSSGTVDQVSGIVGTGMERADASQ